MALAILAIPLAAPGFTARPDHSRKTDGACVKFAALHYLFNRTGQEQFFRRREW
ncbi:MAG TPA: hypothetical protein VJT13_16960 [Xanthobacteraceae bacterium]|nr:hypothetical protein [Xanthobacteraceae bacterium]